MSTISGPRRINSVTVIIALLAVGGGYWLWRIFPAYWDSWTVEHIVNEAAASVYKINNLGEPARTDALHSLVDKTKDKVADAIGDPDTVIDLDINDETETATISAEYDVNITHPWVRKTTRIHFRREGKANVKRVNWKE